MHPHGHRGSQQHPWSQPQNGTTQQSRKQPGLISGLLCMEDGLPAGSAWLGQPEPLGFKVGRTPSVAAAGPTPLSCRFLEAPVLTLQNQFPSYSLGHPRCEHHLSPIASRTPELWNLLARRVSGSEATSCSDINTRQTEFKGKAIKSDKE